MLHRFRNPGFGPFAAITAVTLLLFGLGIWQLYRLQWKNALLANIEQAQSAPPRDLFSIPASELARNEWRNVVVDGTLLTDKELHALPRYLKEQMGYGILTPLKAETPSGPRYVLINRGWVKDLSSPRDPDASAPVIVEGVIRVNVERGRLWRQFFHNSPEKNIWLWYDLPAMQAQLGLPLLPVIIDAARIRRIDRSPMEGAPTPFPLEINIRNDHLGYAVTWFLIGISGLVIFALYFRTPVKNTSNDTGVT